MRKVDRHALRRAIERLKRIPDERERIIQKVIEEGFEGAGQFAAFSVQTDALNLMPWQPPPCWADVDGPEPAGRHPTDGRRAAWLLARRLVAAGLSIYEPEPLAALAAEARGDLPPAAP
jgi:hypothetical protein